LYTPPLVNGKAPSKPANNTPATTEEKPKDPEDKKEKKKKKRKKDL